MRAGQPDCAAIRGDKQSVCRRERQANLRIFIAENLTQDAPTYGRRAHAFTLHLNLAHVLNLGTGEVASQGDRQPGCSAARAPFIHERVSRQQGLKGDGVACFGSMRLFGGMPPTCPLSNTALGLASQAVKP